MSAPSAAAPASPADLPAAGTAASSCVAPSKRRAVPALPLRLHLQFGDGSLPVATAADAGAASSTATSSATTTAAPAASSSASSSSAASGFYSACASSVPLPVISAAGSPLRLELTFLLQPRYRRGDLGAFVSALRAWHIEAHYLFGWAVRTSGGGSGGGADAAHGDDSVEIDGQLYPTLHVTLWANPRLPTNLQLVGAQHHALSRFPRAFARYFGQRSVADLMQAAVQSVYAEAGLPTEHVTLREPIVVRGERRVELAPAAAEGGGDTLQTMLTALQTFLVQASADEVARVLPFTRPNTTTTTPTTTADAATAASSDSTGAPSSTPPTGGGPGLLSAAAAVGPLADLVPDLPSVAPPPAAPLQLDPHSPLFAQLSRGLGATLSLLKKSVAFVRAVRVQRRDEGVGRQTGQRWASVDIEGADFPTIYAFLQHKLATTPPTESDAPPTPPTTTATATHSSDVDDGVHPGARVKQLQAAEAVAKYAEQLRCFAKLITWLQHARTHGEA